MKRSTDICHQTDVAVHVGNNFTGDAVILNAFRREIDPCSRAGGRYSYSLGIQAVSAVICTFMGISNEKFPVGIVLGETRRGGDE